MNQVFISEMQSVREVGGREDEGLVVSRAGCHQHSSGSECKICGRYCRGGGGRWVLCPSTEPWGTPEVTEEGMD